MTMFKFLSKFKSSEDGAVTVDWVVLTAATVGLGVTAITTVSGGTNELGDTVSEAVAGSEVGIDG
ncbi:MAG: hypothetical protein AAF686_04075 [Pseudomonadota bacterium]